MLVRLLLKLYFVTIGFVSAFAITPILPIPLVVGLLMPSAFFFSAPGGQKVKLKQEMSLVNGLFYIFLLIILGSFFLQNLGLGYSDKALRHLFSYFSVVLVFFYIVFFALTLSGIEYKDVFKFIAMGVLLTSIFTIAEFAAKNYSHVGAVLDQVTFQEPYEPLYFINGMSFIRARGTAGESGHFAMYLVMFSPFAFYYYAWMRKRAKLTLIFLLTMLALMLTFSAAAFLSVSFSLLVTACCYLYRAKRNKVKKYLLVITTCAGFIILTMIVNNSYGILDAVISKLTFTDVYSAQDRLRRWGGAVELIAQKPLLGWGPGISSLLNDTGIVNLYLELLSQIGIIGFAIWSFILLTFGRMILKIRGNVCYVFLFSFIAGLVHYAAISNYWFPWLWSLFALITYHYGCQPADAQ